MIQIRTFVPYSLRDLEASIAGVSKEIANRKRSITGMLNYLNNKGKSTAGYSMEFVRVNKPRFETEVTKLRVIKAELVYLYELSRLVNSTSNTTKD